MRSMVCVLSEVEQLNPNIGMVYHSIKNKHTSHNQEKAERKKTNILFSFAWSITETLREKTVCFFKFPGPPFNQNLLSESLLRNNLVGIGELAT